MDTFKHACIAGTLLALVLTACDGESIRGNAQTQNSVAASTARFIVHDNYLYAISGGDIQLFDVQSASSPITWAKVNVAEGIETLFAHGDYLLVGADNGVHIYDNADPASPQRVGDFVHARARDPVVAKGDYAYVTLKRDSRVANSVDSQMNVVDIANMRSPTLAKQLPMQGPAGLAAKGDRLYVCDGLAGLKTFDISNPVAPAFISTIENERCHDVLLDGDRLMTVGDSGIRQYDLTKTPYALLSTLSTQP